MHLARLALSALKLLIILTLSKANLWPSRDVCHCIDHEHCLSIDMMVCCYCLQSLDQSLKQAPPTKKNQVPPREINPPPSLLSQPSAVHHQPAQPRRPPMVHQGQTMPFRQISRHKLDHVHRPRDEELLSIDHVLTQENYKEKFHQLLCREEEEHKKILHER